MKIDVSVHSGLIHCLFVFFTHSCFIHLKNINSWAMFKKYISPEGGLLNFWFKVKDGCQKVDAVDSNNRQIMGETSSFCFLMIVLH